MTKLAIMETREGTEMVKRISYRKVDYVVTEIFRAFIAGTVCYLLGLVLWFFYLWDSLNSFIIGLDFMELLKTIGYRYLIFIAIYGLICAIVAFRRHTKGMRLRYIYLSYLRALKKSYDQDRKAKVRSRVEQRQRDASGRGQENV